MPNDKSVKYFGPQYLARDLFGNLIITMLFFIIAVILIEPLKLDCLELFKDVSETNAISDFGLAIAIALSLAAVGYITNGIYSSAKFYLERITIFRNKFGYARLYARCEGNINRIYNMMFQNDLALCEFPEKGMRLGSKIDRILKHLEYKYPSGYIGVYRYYMFVAILKQAFVYTITLITYILIFGDSKSPAIGLVIFAVVIMLSIKRTIKGTVISEYDYILSSLYYSEIYQDKLMTLIDELEGTKIQEEQDMGL